MPPLVPLVSLQGSFSAHVLAARLASEGIDVELRGALGGAYGLTIGDMARVDVFVPEDQIEDACLVLLAAEVDAAMDIPSPTGVPAASRTRWRWRVAAVVIAVVVGATLVRSLLW